MNNTNDSIIFYLKENAARFPHRNVFSVLENGDDIGKTITYQALELKVRALSFRLGTKELSGKRVLLIYKDIIEFIISFLSCQVTGIIAVPVPDFKGRKQVLRLNNIISDAAITAVLCSENDVNDLCEGLSKSNLAEALEIISTDTDLPEDHIISADDTTSVEDTPYNDIAFIQYTSGSTNNPKGVIISHRNLLHNELMIKNTFGCDESSVILSWLPFHHDMGLIGNILHTIYTGCTCILLAPVHFIQRPLRWIGAISRFSVTHSGGPNFAYDICVEKISSEEAAKADLSSWKVAYNGSEPVQAETIRRFAAHFSFAGFKLSSFYPCYGLAEATLLVSGEKSLPDPLIIHINKNTADGEAVKITDTASNESQEIVGAGKIVSGIKLKIISVQTGEECGELEEGEICIAGDSVTRGYWNKEDTDIFYKSGCNLFLRTGDLGFLYSNELFVRGRIKEMLIIKGVNIYPYDIEQAVFKSHTAVETNGVSIFNLNNTDNAVVLVAEIKRSHLNKVNYASIIEQTDNLIAGTFGINTVDIILTGPLGIPRTTSGKLQRVLCRDYYKQGLFNILESKKQLGQRREKKERNNLLIEEVIQKGDFDSIKKYLADIIEAKFTGACHLELSGNTELTEIGLDSLKAMELINTVNAELDININASKIFQENTVESLIATIENILWLKNNRLVRNSITI